MDDERRIYYQITGVGTRALAAELERYKRIVTLMPVLRNIRAGNSLLASPVSLLIRVVILVFVAWLWAGLLIDQMPCFLGVPNCN